MNKMMRITTFLCMLLFLAGCTAVTMGDKQYSAGPVEPPHFQRLAEVNLAEQAAYEDQTLGDFTLQETADIGVYFSLQDIDAPLLDLSLVTEEGERLVILHGEEFRTDRNGGGLWEQKLSAGSYRLVLTAHDGQGILSVSWGVQKHLGDGHDTN